MSGRWDLYAEQGECRYCGKQGLVKPEPFGSQDACQECWEQICYGDERDTTDSHGTAS